MSKSITITINGSLPKNIAWKKVANDKYVLTIESEDVSVNESVDSDDIKPRYVPNIETASTKYYSEDSGLNRGFRRLYEITGNRYAEQHFFHTNLSDEILLVTSDGRIFDSIYSAKTAYADFDIQAPQWIGVGSTSSCGYIKTVDGEIIGAVWVPFNNLYSKENCQWFESHNLARYDQAVLDAKRIKRNRECAG